MTPLHLADFGFTGPLWEESKDDWWFSVTWDRWCGALINWWTNSPIIGDLKHSCENIRMICNWYVFIFEAEIWHNTILCYTICSSSPYTWESVLNSLYISRAIRSNKCRQNMFFFSKVLPKYALYHGTLLSIQFPPSQIYTAWVKSSPCLYMPWYPMALGHQHWDVAIACVER